MQTVIAYGLVLVCALAALWQLMPQAARRWLRGRLGAPAAATPSRSGCAGCQGCASAPKPGCGPR
ncbi:hypothetical protein ACG0Z6_06285 [Roseateles sp. BYS180W]|uniref:FeoB-associated Cys-rich membrane protein n=1 Tax=Roseateles rivi TaxID=3299028 RepID=A0ABW7FU49_9BURK